MVPTMTSSLSDEARTATDLLRGKAVKHVARHRAGEVLIEFEDGTRLFVDAPSERVELSITGERPPGSER